MRGLFCSYVLAVMRRSVCVHSLRFFAAAHLFLLVLS
jgi:hypothetical protein